MLKRSVAAVLRRFGYRLSRVDGHQTLDLSGLILGALAASEGPLRLVQVGANDGETNDPLRGLLASQQHLRALLIEPQPVAFRKLERLYETDSRVSLAHVAVSNDQSSIRLHALRQQYWDAYRRVDGTNPSGMVSEDWNHVASRVRRRLQVSEDQARAMIEVIEVPSMTLEEILAAQHFGDRFDVLQVDVEGFDDEVILGIDLNRHRLAIVNYEVKHLSPARRDRLAGYLATSGYECFRSGADERALRIREVKAIDR